MTLPRNLPAILRAHGLQVTPAPGWERRGRPGSYTEHGGVLNHHTVTGRNWSDAAVVKLLIGGRPGLSGPLSQLGTARSGMVHIIAAGRANHAGVAKPSGSMSGGDGNSIYTGNEAFNDGVHEDYPKVQYDAIVLLNAVLCLFVTGNSVRTVRGHKETSVTGKVDPRFSMDKFRDDVQAKMNELSAAKPPKPSPGRTSKPQRAAATVVVRNVTAQALIYLGLREGKVKARGGVKVLQRNLNRTYGTDIKIDGVWGEKTNRAWREHERKVGVSGRPGVPDQATVLALSGAIFKVK